LLFGQYLLFLAAYCSAYYRVGKNTLPILVFPFPQCEPLLVDDHIIRLRDLPRVIPSERLVGLLSLGDELLGLASQDDLHKTLLLGVFGEDCPPIGCLQVEGARRLLLVENEFKHLSVGLMEGFKFLSAQVLVYPDDVSHFVTRTLDC